MKALFPISSDMNDAACWMVFMYRRRMRFQQSGPCIRIVPGRRTSGHHASGHLPLDGLPHSCPAM